MTSDRADTAIEGLDDILRGGLPRDRVYLLKGNPGTGKTTLALQFLLAGAAKGEPVLYITLSETRDELRETAASHGWSLDALSVFELQRAESPVGQYTMYHPSEVELGRSMETLLAEVRRVKPARVVFDSLSEMRLLAQEPLRYRRQILDLKHHFAGSQCTVLLLDDHSGEIDNHLESLAHGVIALERHSPVYGETRRRLEVVKLRAVQFRAGFHDFTIERGGLRVYPRLVAAEHHPGYEPGRLRTGVVALDDLLGGGLDYGSGTLMLGPAGCGKSAIATQCAVAAANSGERAVIYTFDESVTTLLTRADSLGIPAREHVKAGRIQVQQIDPAEMSPGQFGHAVRCAVEQERARVVIIDSLTGYLNSMPEERFLLNQLHELLSFLGQHGVVTLLVATQHGLIGTAMAAPVDVSYLADGVILLRYFESGGRIRNAISVVKKRGGAHERTLREFALSTKGGIEIGPPLKDFHGILTGVPDYTGL
jgi:circadian clock protein KaiC